MKLFLLFAILATPAFLATLLVVALYRHKKAGAGEIKLIGEPATVETKLDPVGAVVVRGELWQARSKDGSVIPARARVCVVGFEGHLALVEARN
jgi:membrane-bound serine protease (ClpP class)